MAEQVGEKRARKSSARLSRTRPFRARTGMAITKHKRNQRATRTCPVCGRGAALILNPYYGFRFCRWAERGLCSFSEAQAWTERQSKPGEGR